MTTTKGMTERELLENVIELAHLLGWKVAHFRPAKTEKGWRTPCQADAKGFPDLTLIKGKRTIFAELKSDKGVLTFEQDRWIKALKQGKPRREVYIWKPADWLSGEIERVLRGES